MVAFIPALAVLLGAACASGKYFSHSRYDEFYGHSYSNGKFFDNNIARADFKKGTYVVQPSLNTVNVIDSLNFDYEERDGETNIFNGLMRVPKCKAGVYKFRITSDDAAHLLIDGNMVVSNPGDHVMTTAEGVVAVTSGQAHQFELWWGNYQGKSGLKVEYCFHPLATQKLRELSVQGEDDNKLISEMDLGAFECHMTTDFSKIMVSHDVASVRRCDFDGYFKDNLDFFSGRAISTKLLSTGCADEVGGKIHGKGDKFPNMSFTFTATLKPQQTGQHSFWARCDDACYLFITQPDGNRIKVASAPGDHDPINSLGRVFLEKGQEYGLKFYYGSYQGYGEYTLMYKDPTMDEFSESLQSVLV